jgi:predicted XRE-type DNA-binding protein
MPHWVDPVPALKRRVADEIVVLIEGWSQSFAPSFMDCRQSRVSDLRRGHLERMSLERMLQCLSHLSRNIEINTTRGPGGSCFEHWKIDGRQLGGGAGVPRKAAIQNRIVASDGSPRTGSGDDYQGSE